jgi:hypothetical protein
MPILLSRTDLDVSLIALHIPLILTTVMNKGGTMERRPGRRSELAPGERPWCCRIAGDAYRQGSCRFFGFSDTRLGGGLLSAG